MAKVFVGMSGGVDSSLTAALLVEQGHEVTGVYMKNWTKDLPGMVCPWAQDLADAKRVAVHLGIPFVVYDFESEYKRKVVDYMIDEYSAGRTPNPDIMCNQEVKFKLFLETSLENGADMIATGHYARTKNGRLFMAEDSIKDQTYFLYRVSESALQKTLFPIGDLKKSDVRKLAVKKNLATANRPDSQGICFVGSVGIKDFLSEYIQGKPGDIIERESKKVVGRHDGAIFYTIGQRHGLGVGGGLPYYVVAKDMVSNQIIVSRNLNDESMWQRKIKLTDFCWINDKPKKGGTFKVRLRHRGELRDARLENDTLYLSQPERSVASGQSAVIYHANEVLGGGIIS